MEGRTYSRVPSGGVPEVRVLAVSENTREPDAWSTWKGRCVKAAVVLSLVALMAVAVGANETFQGSISSTV